MLQNPGGHFFKKNGVKFLLRSRERSFYVQSWQIFSWQLAGLQSAGVLVLLMKPVV
jgi:hypothetical protein